MKRRGWRDVDPRLGAGLVLLVVLWLAAAVPAVLSAADRVRERTTADELGGAVDTVVVALQEERRLSAAFLAGGEAAPLSAARGQTDRAGAQLSALTGGWSHTEEARAGVEELTSKLGTLGTIRFQVDRREDERAEILAAYRTVVAAAVGMPWLPAGQLAQAREALAEEDALLRAALSTRAGVADAELVRIGELAGERRAWLGSSVVGTSLEPLAALEARLILGGRPPVAPADWAAVADPVNAALREAEARTVRDALEASAPEVISATVFAGAVAGVGLIAVIGVVVLTRRYAAGAGTRAPAADTAPRADEAPGLQGLLLDLHYRSQRLIHRQLRLLDSMERRQDDGETLDQLFRADHLGTRVRRNVEKAVTLAGGLPGRQWHRPMPLGEVVRGAAAEVDDYTRVATSEITPAALAGDAVLEITHLLAELIENAVTYAPAESRVRVTGTRDDDGGYTLTVTDTGPGMSDLDIEHAQLVMADPEPPGGGVWSGFYAVGRFAARWGAGVHLARGESGGLIASVHLPTETISDQETEMSETATTYVDLSVV